MGQIFWGVITLFMWLVAIGCMVNNQWGASMIFFGLGVGALYGAQPHNTTYY